MSQQKNKTKQEPIKEIPKKVRVITWSILSVVILGVLSVLIWMEFRPAKVEPPLPDRFENITHITSPILNVILQEKFADELNEEDLEVWEEIEKELKHNVYVFIYNQDYEQSPDSENLEALVNEIHNKEDKSFTFLVLNYLENEDVISILSSYSNISLPESPVLIHIEGETIKAEDVATNYLSIQRELVKLREV